MRFLLDICGSLAVRVQLFVESQLAVAEYVVGVDVPIFVHLPRLIVNSPLSGGSLSARLRWRCVCPVRKDNNLRGLLILRLLRLIYPPYWAGASWIVFKTVRKVRKSASRCSRL